MALQEQQIIAGIDVGSSKVCTIIGQISESSESVNILGVSTVPSRGIRKGQVVDITAATASIVDGLESAQRMAGYNLTSAYVSVGGSHIQSRNSHAVVAVSRPDAEIGVEDVDRVSDAARAITIPSSRDIIHVIPRMFIVDGQDGIKDPIGMAGIRLEIETHIVHGAAISLKNLTRCIHDIKLNVESFVFSGLASAHATLTDTEKELGVVSIDIGGGTTDITMYVDGALSHSAVLPVGAKNITNDIAIGLRVSLQTAEQIKLLLSKEPSLLVSEDPGNLKPFDREGRKKLDEIDLSRFSLGEDLQSVSRKLLLEGIIRPRLEEIFNHVLMEFKRSGYQNAIPAGVVVSGGGAETVGLVEIARRTLGLPVRIGVPQNVTGLIDEIQHPAYASAVGLLLYGANDFSQDEAPTSSIFSMPKMSMMKEGGNFVQQFMKWVKGFLP